MIKRKNDIERDRKSMHLEKEESVYLAIIKRKNDIERDRKSMHLEKEESV